MIMVNCCVASCNNNRKNSSVTLHQFPSREKEPQRYNVWKNRINRKNFYPNSNNVICSLHFKDEDFENNLMRSLLPNEKIKRMLKNTAVPSLMLAAIKDEVDSGEEDDEFQDENISMEYTDPPEMKFTEETINIHVTESSNSSTHQPVLDTKPIEMNNVDDFCEIDSFFKGIVETVKKLSPVNQVLLQKQIANLVFDMKLKELQEQE